jgi:ABC-type transport system substrate-binding protein
LKDAGFQAELQLVDFGVFLDKVRGGEAGMWMLYNSTPPIADDTINRYTGSFYPGSNWIGLQDSAYDGLVAQGIAAATETEKAGFFNDAQKRLIDLNVLYPVSTYGYNMILQPYMSGVEIYGDNTVSFRNVVLDK